MGQGGMAIGAVNFEYGSDDVNVVVSLLITFDLLYPYFCVVTALIVYIVF